MRLLSYKLRAPNHGVFLSPHTTCEMKYILRQSWSGCTRKQNQPEAAATGNGGMGTDDTTLSEGVEQSSFAAAGSRMLVHLTSSFSTAYPGGSPGDT